MNKPKLILYKEETITIGQDTFIECVAENNNAVVFEDNTETGYFYAVSMHASMKILDALHIYNVADIIDKEKPSVIRILWTEDLSMAFLSINHYYHAVFDFNQRAGYCRNGFPRANHSWTRIKERTLTDDKLYTR